MTLILIVTEPNYDYTRTKNRMEKDQVFSVTCLFSVTVGGDKMGKKQKLIRPPKGTTPTYYWNRAMECKAKMKTIGKKIAELKIAERYLQQDYNSNMSAYKNGIKWDEQNK